jgi:hypothetical protein
VAELTGLLYPTGWPKGMRGLVRRERPHPGAQLRFDDVDGYRLTAFATNTKRGRLADLEVRHRRRARCEDRIRIAKDMGLQNLPLKTFTRNLIWCQIVALASEITTWMDLLAHPEKPARRLGAQTPPAPPVPSPSDLRPPCASPDRAPLGPLHPGPHRPDRLRRALRPARSRYGTAGPPLPAHDPADHPARRARPPRPTRGAPSHPQRQGMHKTPRRSIPQSLAYFVISRLLGGGFPEICRTPRERGHATDNGPVLSRWATVSTVAGGADG